MCSIKTKRLTIRCTQCAFITCMLQLWHLNPTHHHEIWLGKKCIYIHLSSLLQFFIAMEYLLTIPRICYKLQIKFSTLLTAQAQGHLINVNKNTVRHMTVHAIVWLNFLLFFILSSTSAYFTFLIFLWNIFSNNTDVYTFILVFQTSIVPSHNYQHIMIDHITYSYQNYNIPQTQLRLVAKKKPQPNLHNRPILHPILFWTWMYLSSKMAYYITMSTYALTS